MSSKSRIVYDFICLIVTPWFWSAVGATIWKFQAFKYRGRCYSFIQTFLEDTIFLMHGWLRNLHTSMWCFTKCSKSLDNFKSKEAWSPRRQNKDFTPLKSWSSEKSLAIKKTRRNTTISLLQWKYLVHCVKFLKSLNANSSVKNPSGAGR